MYRLERPVVHDLAMLHRLSTVVGKSRRSDRTGLTKAPKPTTTSSRFTTASLLRRHHRSSTLIIPPHRNAKKRGESPSDLIVQFKLETLTSTQPLPLFSTTQSGFCRIAGAGTTTTPRFVARVTFEENRDRAPSRTLKSRSHGRGARRALAEKARGAPAAGRWPIELLPNRSSCAACGWRARAGGRQARMAGRGRSSCCAACGWRARPRVVRARTRENVAVRSARGGQRCWFGWRRSAVPSAAREASSFRCSAVLQGPRDQAGYARLHARCGAR
jgi:hypothetical protein